MWEISFNVADGLLSSADSLVVPLFVNVLVNLKESGGSLLAVFLVDFAAVLFKKRLDFAVKSVVLRLVVLCEPSFGKIDIVFAYHLGVGSFVFVHVPELEPADPVVKTVNPLRFQSLVLVDRREIFLNDFLSAESAVFGDVHNVSLGGLPRVKSADSLVRPVVGVRSGGNGVVRDALPVSLAISVKRRPCLPVSFLRPVNLNYSTKVDSSPGEILQFNVAFGHSSGKEALDDVSVVF